MQELTNDADVAVSEKVLSKYATIAPYIVASVNGPQMDARFQQSLPSDREWLLVENGGGNLLYRDDEGSELLVPAAWYNQTTEMCATRWRLCAEELRLAAAYKRAHVRYSWDLTDAKRSEVKARKFESRAAKIVATGKPGYWFRDD